MIDNFRRIILVAYHANDTLKGITLHKGDDQGRIVRLILRYCEPSEVQGVRLVINQDGGLWQTMEPVPGEQFATFEAKLGLGNVTAGTHQAEFKVSMAAGGVVNTLYLSINVVDDFVAELEPDTLETVEDMISRGYDVINAAQGVLDNVSIELQEDGTVIVTDKDANIETFTGLKIAAEQAQNINIALAQNGVVTVTYKDGTAHTFNGLKNAIDSISGMITNVHIAFDEQTGIITVVDEDGNQTEYEGIKDAIADAESATTSANEAATHAENVANSVDRITISLNRFGELAIKDRNGNFTVYNGASLATAAANSAAADATLAAQEARTAISEVEDATTAANTAASNANEAATAANEAALRESWCIVGDEFRLGVTAHVDQPTESIILGRA